MCFLLFHTIRGVDFVIPILQLRKCWLREADEFAQGHTVTEDVPTLKPECNFSKVCAL